MGASFGHARRHEQDRLFAVERLDLRFLVHAQHHGAGRRRQIKAGDVLHFVDEQRIARQLERLRPVRLQANAPQIRRIVVCDSPAFAAIERID